MRIEKVTFQMGRDFNAIMKCEHCSAEQENRNGYNDAYFHEMVIPGMFCKACGKNRAGEAKTSAVAELNEGG